MVLRYPYTAALLVFLSTAVVAGNITPGDPPAVPNGINTRNGYVPRTTALTAAVPKSAQPFRRTSKPRPIGAGAGSNLIFSKVFFFGCQPAISILLATYDSRRCNRMNLHQRSNTRERYSQGQGSSLLKVRGGGAVAPFFVLARSIVSAGVIASAGIAIALGERFFGIFGQGVPSIISCIFNLEAKKGDYTASRKILTSRQPYVASGTDIACHWELPNSAILFALASTVLGTLFVTAATLMLAIKPDGADFFEFAMLNSIGIVVTYAGVLIGRGKLDWLNIVATRGVLPWGIFLGLLSFLGVYA